MSSAITTRALRKIYPLPPQRRKRGGAHPLPASVPGAGVMQAQAANVAADGIVAVEALDLDIPEGEFFGVLGPNGAGKTTTIGILTTRVRLTAGQAIVAGPAGVGEPGRGRRAIGVV